MAKISWGGGALLAPVPPALVTCGTLDAPAVLTVAWTGILNTRPPRTYISVRPERASFPIIKERGEFAVNLAPASLARAVDLCGCTSGRTTDKFARAGLTPEAAQQIAAPLLAECPVSLECRVFDTRALGSHVVFFADIVAVDVEEALIDAAGRLCLERAGLLAYAHGEYFALGQKVGSFGFAVRKKPLAGAAGGARKAGPVAGSRPPRAVGRAAGGSAKTDAGKATAGPAHGRKKGAAPGRPAAAPPPRGRKPKKQ